MSKYRDVKIKGDGNQLGDNITNHTRVTNKFYTRESPNSDGGEIMVICLGSFALLFAVIWSFFTQIDQVYFYLKIGAATSPVLAILTFAVCWMSGYSEKVDLTAAALSVGIGLVLLLIVKITRQNISTEIVQHALQTNFLSFWGDLTDYGKKSVIFRFVEAVYLGVAILVAHLFSLRQLSKGAGHPDKIGFWYAVYESLSLFKTKNTSIFMLILASVGFFWLNFLSKY